MPKLPHIPLYPGDWLRDDVAGCSLAAQGLWLRMMFLMHDSERYGFLSQNGCAMQPATIARRCGCELAEYQTNLLELVRAGVPSTSEDGTIFCRRMVRDHAAKQQAQENGRKGGNPNLTGKRANEPPSKGGVNPPDNPSLTMKMKMKKEDESPREGECAKSTLSVFLEESGLGFNCGPVQLAKLGSLLKTYSVEDCRRAVSTAMAQGIGGGGAISYAETMLGGERGRKDLRNQPRTKSPDKIVIHDAG